MRSITYIRPQQKRLCEHCKRRLRNENEVGVTMYKCHVCFKWYEDKPAVTSEVD